jgi:hypothetical protein
MVNDFSRSPAIMMAGIEYFLEPSVPAQRRYEALRAYIVEGVPGAEVAQPFGYSTSTLHQLAAELRAGRSEFFRSSKPGPRGPRKAHTIRDRVLKLRARDRSVTEITVAFVARAGLGADGVVDPPRRGYRTPRAPLPRRPRPAHRAGQGPGAVRVAGGDVVAL